MIYSIDIPKDLLKLTDDDLSKIAYYVNAELKSRGYAVITWTPQELKKASPNRVEERSIELGWDVIRDLQ